LDPEQRLERVEALRHDLGKYLVLPVGMLPADAGRGALAEALDQALHRTRRDSAGVRGAGALWAEFAAELGTELAGSPGYGSLQSAVQRALGWAERLADPAAPLDRAQILRELRAVGEAIDGLAEELRHA
jgi:hypothetical protein